MRIPEPSATIYTDENKLLAECMKWLEPQERDGIVVLKIRDRCTRGYADLFINARGRFVVAELKDDIGVASVHQEDFLYRMSKAHAVSGICRSVKDVADLIDKALYCNCMITGVHRVGKYCIGCGREVRYPK